MTDILHEAKRYIDADKFDSLRDFWFELHDAEYDTTPDWVSLFQKIYIHACLKGRAQIASWLQNTVFPHLDPIQQIAVRQTFSYGKHLLQKAKK